MVCGRSRRPLRLSACSPVPSERTGQSSRAPGARDSEVAFASLAPSLWLLGQRAQRGSLGRGSAGLQRAPREGWPLFQRGMSPEAVITFNSSGGSFRGGLEDAPPDTAWGQGGAGQGGTVSSYVGPTRAQDVNERVRYSPRFRLVTAHREIGI